MPDLLAVAIGIAALVRALAAYARQNPVRRVLSPVAYPKLASFEAGLTGNMDLSTPVVKGHSTAGLADRSQPPTLGFTPSRGWVFFHSSNSFSSCGLSVG